MIPSLNTEEKRMSTGSEIKVEMKEIGERQQKEILPGHPDFAYAERIRRSILLSISDPILTVGVLKSQRKVEFKETGAFEFREYLPAEFRKIRELSGISEDDYAMEFSGDLSEFSVNSKGGMRIYITSGGRFLIKWVTCKESKVLRAMFPAYVAHITATRSLLNKCFGLLRIDTGKRRCHCVKPDDENIYFQVLENTFWRCCTPPDRIYDIKGSSAGRHSSPGDTILKDLDFIDEANGERNLHLGSSLSSKFLEQLRLDVSLLEEAWVMDYSLLIGIKFITSRTQLYKNSSGEETVDGGWYSADDSCVYYFGIIDMLQDWSIKKKSAGCFKQYCLCHQQETLSTVRPDHYARRFLKFVSDVVD